jgi:GTP cyclohydrolase I
MAIHTLTQRYRSILAAVGNALTAEELANLSTRVLKAMRSKGYCATRSVKKVTRASQGAASENVHRDSVIALNFVTKR